MIVFAITIQRIIQQFFAKNPSKSTKWKATAYGSNFPLVQD